MSNINIYIIISSSHIIKLYYTTTYLGHCPGGSSRAWLALVVGNPCLNRRDLEISVQLSH